MNNNISNISWFYIEDFDLDGDFDIITQDSNNLNGMVYYQNNLSEFSLLGYIRTVLYSFPSPTRKTDLTKSKS